MYKHSLIDSISLCISNLEFVNRDVTESPQHDLIASTTEMLTLLVILIENTNIEN